MSLFTPQDAFFHESTIFDSSPHHQDNRMSSNPLRLMDMKFDGLQTSPGHSYLLHQQAGERALRDKRYGTAKYALDLAWQQASHDPSKNCSILISILDLRAEVEVRQKNYAPAYKDARMMAKLDPTDPRGFLRCGQLCTLKHDLAAAQLWYRRGLANVPETHESYHQISSMSLKLNSKLSLKTTSECATRQSKPADPFTVLPMDLIHMVIDHLEFRVATSCLRVSRTWRNILLATHSTWKSLDFQGPNLVVLRHLKACIRRLPKPPATIGLDRLNKPAIEHLQPYLRRWRATEHMSINLPELRDLACVSSAETTLKSLHVGEACIAHIWHVNSMLYRCTALQKARFDSVLVNGDLPTREDSALLSRQSVIRPELSHLVLIAKNADGTVSQHAILTVSFITLLCFHQLTSKVWSLYRLPKPSSITL
jgi:F-box domain